MPQLSQHHDGKSKGEKAKNKKFNIDEDNNFSIDEDNTLCQCFLVVL